MVSTKLEAYSYHTTSRFGSRVKIKVDNQIITISGPRMSVKVYYTWLLLQGILSTSMIIGLSFGLYSNNFSIICVGFGFFLLHVGGCMLGTAIWELHNLLGHETATYNVREVKDILIGRGWSRGGLWLFIPFYVLFMSLVSRGNIVSFRVLGNENQKGYVYALTFPDMIEADNFLSLIKA